MKLLLVNPSRAPSLESVAAGGGFQWARDVALVRNGEIITRATGWPITYKGDVERPGLAAENERIVVMAKPGDRLIFNCQTFGNDSREWVVTRIVASPSKRDFKYRPMTYCPMEGSRWSRQYRAEARREGKRLARERLKEKAKERLWRIEG